MRFCHVTTFYPPYSTGGDAVFVQRLAHALARRGHETHVVHCGDAYRFLNQAPPTPAPKEPDGVTVHRIEHPLGPISPLLTQQTGRPGLKAGALRRILQPGRFDVVHFHNISLIGGPGILGMGDGVKLLTLHEHWLICPTHVLLKMGREPCIEKSCLRCVLQHRRPPQVWRYTGLVERSMRHVDACLAPSETTRRRHRAEGIRTRIERLPYFVPAEAERDQECHETVDGMGEERFFLFVGRIEPLKGLHTLIPVILRHPQFRLVVAGGGDALEEAQRLAAGCDRIRFLGRVSPDRARALQRRALACVVPSLAAEVSPLVIAEAAAAGTPVVARNVGALAELLGRGPMGLTYKTEDELIEALHRLGADPGMAARLGEAGKRAYAEIWSEEAHLTQYFALIDELRRPHSKARVAAEPRVPRPWPIVGHAPAFARDKLGFLERCARDPREAVPLSLHGPTWLLKSPEDIAHVLESGHARYEKTSRLTSPRGRALTGNGLHTSSTAEQRALRLELQPAYGARAIGSHLPGLQARADARLQAWNGRVAARAESTALLRDAFGGCLFGDDWSEALAQATEARRRYLQHWYSLPVWLADLLPLPVRWRHRRATAFLREALRTGIARRRAGAPCGDFLADLASLRDARGDLLPVERVIDEALTFSVTSYDSASESLAWTLLLLAAHPGVQEEVAAEVQHVFGAAPPDAPGLARLELTGRVLDESLRLYPPTWLTVRMVREPDLLPSGVPVSRGSRLYICPWILHREPRFFPDPARFDPQRFTPEQRRTRPRLAFLPFGAGPRACIGQPFARATLLLVLARVAQRFRLRAAADARLVPRPGLTLAPPDGACLMVEARS